MASLGLNKAEKERLIDYLREFPDAEVSVVSELFSVVPEYVEEVSKELAKSDEAEAEAKFESDLATFETIRPFIIELVKEMVPAAKDPEPESDDG